MNEAKARALLPGAGDIQQQMNEIHEKLSNPRCDEFTLKQGEEMLDWLLDWLMDSENELVDNEDEDEDEDMGDFLDDDDDDEVEIQEDEKEERRRDRLED